MMKEWEEGSGKIKKRIENKIKITIEIQIRKKTKIQRMGKQMK
jgi:hypothetical protein